MDLVKILQNLSYIFRPRFWISNYPVDMQWDRELNQMMDEGRDFVREQHVTVFEGNIVVWTSNYPYAYGSLEHRGKPDLIYRLGGRSSLPRRCTRERLFKYVQRGSGPKIRN